MIVHILFFILLILAVVWSIRIFGRYVSEKTSSKLLAIALTTVVGCGVVFAWLSALDIQSLVTDVNTYLAKAKFDNLFQTRILNYILKFDALTGVRGFDFGLLALCTIALGMMLTHKDIYVKEDIKEDKPNIPHTLTNIKCNNNLNTYIINRSILR